MTLSRVAYFEHAAVASEQPLASLAGSEVLRHGGNAFDAAVATSFALAVTFHPAGGLGGDLFAMMYEAKTGMVHCLNSSGWSPSGLSAELVRSRGEKSVPVIGPYSAVVPGLVAGDLAMHRKFGTIGLRRLLAPAINYARKGFPASEGICRSVAGTYDTLPPAAKRVFAPRGGPPQPGELLRQENLGNVMEAVARGGANAFYRGWPAEKMSAALTELGVPTRKSDFSTFRPEWVKPLVLNYNGTDVYEVPPNSMGATSLLILKQLASKDLKKAGPLSKERIELTMEAAELAYARRDEMLGDPRFGRVDMERFMRLGGNTEPTQGLVRGGDTTAFSVADKEGNLVSAIQSLFHHFGSRVFVEDCGIMMSSRGAGFSLDGPNKVEPRKRPLHTLSAILLDRGRGPTVALGTSGGEYRPVQHILFVTNIVDFSMSVEQSIDHPRFLWSGGRPLIVESGYESLTPSRYDVENVAHPGRTGVCQAVDLLPDAMKAVCDVRGDGIPAGY